MYTKCYAQLYKPENVTAVCCPAVEADLEVDIREINAGIIRGKVVCAKDNKPLANSIIAARNKVTQKIYYSIADNDGSYEMLVAPGIYEVAAFPNCDWYGKSPVECQKMCENCIPQKDSADEPQV